MDDGWHGPYTTHAECMLAVLEGEEWMAHTDEDAFSDDPNR
jgi:hypothetical protein